MTLNKWISQLSLMLMCLTTMEVGRALPDDNPFGQTITIDTRFHSFVGNPVWTLIIRDVDHGQNIPYMFNIERGGNHWVIFTYGRNYLVSASNMQIETYQGRYNKYKNYRMRNFCQMESNGRILRGESMYITIEGDLSPYTSNFNCNISTYADPNFYVYRKPGAN